MYSVLTESVKRRMILELREFWSKDPKYRDSLVPNIQGRFSFREKPQQAIILKNSSASTFQLSADHFQGTVVSYCHLAKVFGKSGVSIEWVKEASRQIQNNGGVFPSPPGIYYIEVRKAGIDWNNVPGGFVSGAENCPPPGSPADTDPIGTGQSFGMEFFVDPLLTVLDERLIMVDPTHYEVAAGKFHPGSIQIFEMPGNLPLYEGVNYEADPATGQVTLTTPTPSNTYLSVDYYYAGESRGPFPIADNTANTTAIPGVVLAFGRRITAGDIMVVSVTEQREPSAKEYGGRWELSLDIDVLARDTYAQAEILDRTLLYIHANLRDRLSFDGIEITAVSSGGEGEEQYDENGDDLYYTSSISLTLETEWSIHLPLSQALNRIIPNTIDQVEAFAGLSDEQISELGSPTLLLLTETLALQSIQDPWFQGLSRNYEMIR